MGTNGMLYNCNKVSPNHNGSNIDSQEWLKSKKAPLNSKNNDDKCFQYVIKVLINHQNIKNYLERKSNIESFINEYNWKEKMALHCRKEKY